VKKHVGLIIFPHLSGKFNIHVFDIDSLITIISTRIFSKINKVFFFQALGNQNEWNEFLRRGFGSNVKRLHLVSPVHNKERLWISRHANCVIMFK
jgi:hypothetical protein